MRHCRDRYLALPPVAFAFFAAFAIFHNDHTAARCSTLATQQRRAPHPPLSTAITRIPYLPQRPLRHGPITTGCGPWPLTLCGTGLRRLCPRDLDAFEEREIGRLRCKH